MGTMTGKAEIIRGGTIVICKSEKNSNVSSASSQHKWRRIRLITNICLYNQNANVNMCSTLLCIYGQYNIRAFVSWIPKCQRCSLPSVTLYDRQGTKAGNKHIQLYWCRIYIEAQLNILQEKSLVWTHDTLYHNPANTSFNPANTSHFS